MVSTGNRFYLFSILKDISSLGWVKYKIFMAIATWLFYLRHYHYV